MPVLLWLIVRKRQPIDGASNHVFALTKAQISMTPFMRTLLARSWPRATLATLRSMACQSKVSVRCKWPRRLQATNLRVLHAPDERATHTTDICIVTSKARLEKCGAAVAEAVQYNRCFNCARTVLHCAVELFRHAKLIFAGTSPLTSAVVSIKAPKVIVP